MLPDVAARRHPRRDHGGSADLAAGGQPGQRRHRRHLERRPPVERGDGEVGAAVRHAHDVLHRRSLAEPSPGDGTRTSGVRGRLQLDEQARQGQPRHLEERAGRALPAPGSLAMTTS